MDFLKVRVLGLRIGVGISWRRNSEVDFALGFVGLSDRLRFVPELLWSEVGRLKSRERSEESESLASVSSVVSAVAKDMPVWRVCDVFVMGGGGSKVRSESEHSSSLAVVCIRERKDSLGEILGGSGWASSTSFLALKRAMTSSHSSPYLSSWILPIPLTARRRLLLWGRSRAMASRRASEITRVGSICLLSARVARRMTSSSNKACDTESRGSVSV